MKVKGHFDRLHGWLEIGDDGRRRLELTIEADSVNTGNDKRDEHLRSADFFDAQRHPEVRFISTAVSDPVGRRLQVEGELLAAGNRVVLELEPTVQQTSDDLADRREHDRRPARARHDLEPARDDADPGDAHRSRPSEAGALMYAPRRAAAQPAGCSSLPSVDG